MPHTEEEIARIERAYRKALFKMVVNLGFLAVCCIGATVLRKMFGLPPAFLSVVLVIALLLFSPEIFRFMVLRNQVRSIREEK